MPDLAVVAVVGKWYTSDEAYLLTVPAGYIWIRYTEDPDRPEVKFLFALYRLEPDIFTTGWAVPDGSMEVE